MAEFLGDEGHTAVRWNGTEAPLELLRREQPALVLLDLRLSHALDGFTLLELLRQDAVLGRVPVILCSADRPVLTQHAERFARLDATVLHKPFDLTTLGLLVQRLLRPADGSTPVAAMGPLRCHM